MLNILLSGQENLFVLLSAFIIGGIFKTRNIFAPAFAALVSRVKSKRVAMMGISLLSGILPIEGRVIVSAPILDSLASKEHSCSGTNNRGKLGILDYIASHHYYLWSPLEKTIILTMGTLGMTYVQVLSYTVLPLLVYLSFLGFIVFRYIKEEDILLSAQSNIWTYRQLFNMVPFVLGIAISLFYPPHFVFPVVAAFYMLAAKVDFKEMMSFIKWDTLIYVSAIIVAANILKMYSGSIIQFLHPTSNTLYPFLSVALAATGAACASFILGSSSKFAGIAAGLTLIFGVQYFPIFFMADYAAYLVSPTHKCLPIAKSYFGTGTKEFYKYIGALAVLMILTAIPMMFFR